MYTILLTIFKNLFYVELHRLCLCPSQCPSSSWTRLALWRAQSKATWPKRRATWPALSRAPPPTSCRSCPSPSTSLTCSRGWRTVCRRRRPPSKPPGRTGLGTTRRPLTPCPTGCPIRMMNSSSRKRRSFVPTLLFIYLYDVYVYHVRSLNLISLYRGSLRW